MSLLKKVKWVAHIQDKHWIVAKISRNKKSLKIHKLLDLTGDLKQRFKEERIPLKKLEVAISCPGMITRLITLPLLSNKELEMLLTEHVDQYFTVNIEDYLIDYRLIEKFEEDGQKRQRVLLAAIPKYQWEKFQLQWKELGFVPKVVDLAPSSLARLYRRGGGAGKSAHLNIPSDLAIVDLGSDRVEIIILEKGIFFLYSDLEVNLSALEEVEVQADRFNILDPVLLALSDFLSFFSSRHYGKSVDEVYITGTYADIPLLCDTFNQVLAIDTILGFPDGWYPRFNKKCGTMANNWTKYGTLYGLALREEMQEKHDFNFALRWEQQRLKDLRQKREFTKIIRWGILGLAIVGFLGSIPWLWEYKLMQDLQSIDLKIQTLNTLDAEVKQRDDLKDQIEEKKQLQELISSTQDPAPVLNRLQSLLPAGSFVDSLTLSEENRMVIRVTVSGPVDVATLWINLRDSQLFEAVDIQTVSLQDQNQTLNLALKLKMRESLR